MSFPLVFRAAAQKEFDQAAAWYEKQKAGLGAEYVDEIQRVLSRIADQADRSPVVWQDIREAPVPRFPYAIYYRVKATRIVIIAVFHCSRDPSLWQGRA